MKKYDKLDFILIEFENRIDEFCNNMDSDKSLENIRIQTKSKILQYYSELDGAITRQASRSIIYLKEGEMNIEDRLDIIIDTLYYVDKFEDIDGYKHYAKTAILELFRECVPEKENIMKLKGETLRKNMIGWNTCIDEIKKRMIG